MQRHQQLSAQGTPSHRGWQPLQHWETLNPGDLVEVWSEGRILHLAYVDDLSEDGRIVWLLESGTASRRLFLREDAITLYTPKPEFGRLIGLPS
ncbi:hypothetical protein [Paenarthrobacter nitroguajacolicus]|uniref:hypothetical protein n=1 Tax=Paenarthrobacter nitroguajacolicus TaxID=211146 RepID=UPI000A966739|nr:hypothetical protein [Paenarthrobacter nitroguajacolicus]